MLLNDTGVVIISSKMVITYSNKMVIMYIVQVEAFFGRGKKTPGKVPIDPHEKSFEKSYRG
jgi:hypothetical protein